MTVRLIPENAIPGVTVLPFWQAQYYTKDALDHVDAILWHMAEGFGTDSWLRHPSNNNSSHIVVKAAGSIRQMVSFLDASHSVHVDPRSDNPSTAADDGIFGLGSVKRALGAYWKDPNRRVVAIEVEGTAAIGPSRAQIETILDLAVYLERLFPDAVHLGHRDFQDYKACPGKHLFNEVLPHEGRITGHTAGDNQQPGEDMLYVNANGAEVTSTRRINVSAGSPWLFLNGAPGGKIPGAEGTIQSLVWVGKGDSQNNEHVILLPTGTPYTDGSPRPSLVLVRSTNTPYDVAAPQPAPDPKIAELTAQLDALHTTNVLSAAQLRKVADSLD